MSKTKHLRSDAKIVRGLLVFGVNQEEHAFNATDALDWMRMNGVLNKGSEEHGVFTNLRRQKYLFETVSKGNYRLTPHALKIIRDEAVKKDFRSRFKIDVETAKGYKHPHGRELSFQNGGHPISYTGFCTD